MIFITPMPPTSRPKPEIAIEIKIIMELIRSKFSMIESAVASEKSSSMPVGVWRSLRIAVRISSIASARWPGRALAVRKKV